MMIVDRLAGDFHVMLLLLLTVDVEAVGRWRTSRRTICRLIGIVRSGRAPHQHRLTLVVLGRRVLHFWRDR